MSQLKTQQHLFLLSVGPRTSPHKAGVRYGGGGTAGLGREPVVSACVCLQPGPAFLLMLPRHGPCMEGGGVSQ